MRFWIEYEFDSLILGNGKLQGTNSVLMLVRRRAGRPIMLSYQALWSFLGIKSYLFCAMPYHVHKFQISINWQGRSTSYIWLAFALISLLNRKRDSRKRWKKGGTPDFPVKVAEMRDPGTSIRHLHFFYSTPCLLPKILHNLCFKFLLGITLVPREIENNAYRFYSKNAPALIKFFYGKMRLLFEGSVYFSESWTQNKNCGHPLNTDTSLLRTVCFFPGERKHLQFLLI